MEIYVGFVVGTSFIVGLMQVVMGGKEPDAWLWSALWSPVVGRVLGWW